MKVSRAAIISAASIMKGGGLSQSKYLHPDANTLLDLWSFAQLHECFPFKDSGALVRSIHQLLNLRVSTWLTCAALKLLLSLTHTEEHAFMRYEEELLEKKRFSKDINAVKVSIYEDL